MKHSLAFIFLLAMIGILTGCTDQRKEDQKSAEKYEKVQLVMSVNGTDTSIDTLTARHFSRLVSEASGGNVSIEVYPDDKLMGGNANEAVRSLSEGAVDIGGYVSGTMSMLDSRLEIAMIPWTFSDYQEVRKIIDDTGGDYYAKILSEHGLIYLGSTHNAMRQLANNRNPVRTPEDLRGMKIRVLGSDIYSLFFSAFDAEPIPLSWSEIKIAIHQGVIDGQENGFFLMRSGNLNEVQHYMTVWNYLYENYLFAVNRKSFDQLQPKTQTLLREKMKEACEWSRDYLETEEVNIRKLFAMDGLEIIEPTPEELAVFKARVQPLRETLKRKYGAEACAAFQIDTE